MLNTKNAKGKIICIYGPTASSKSKLALNLAKKIGGVVINADSMQVYKDMPILTAQPSEQYMLVEHRLYSIISPTSNFSVNDWLKLAVEEITQAKKNGQIPILVGGTGMYFSSMIKGIAKIPSITEETRQRVRSEIENLSTDQLHNLLSKHDIDLAKKLQPNDRIRILRGLEVVFQTNKSILKWQKINTIFFDEKDFFNIYIRPERDLLYKRINKRFLYMIKDDVENEVKHVMEKYKGEKLPKILGLSEIQSYILHRIEFDEMVSEVQKLTRNYAKRQYTWFNNQLSHNLTLNNLEDFVI
jgi:tRNA dimethylallyltransferase